MNSPIIFYHLWAVGEWTRIHKNIFEKIVSSGLAKAMSEINICVNSEIPFTSIELHGIDPNKVNFIRVEDTKSEWPTLDKLYERTIQLDNTPVLYLHCKGARFTPKDANYGPINSWVNGMVYFNVTKWKKCLSHLAQGRASVGIRVARMPVPHYSGNFWWINSNQIKLLLNPKTQDQTHKNRYGAEFWIGRLGINNLFDCDLTRSDFGYTRIIDPKKYEETDKSNRGVCVYKIGNQDISWVNRIGLEYDVYSKQSNLKKDSVAEAFITHIVENYDELSKYTFFLNSSAIYTIANLEHIIKNQYTKYQAFGRLHTRDDNTGKPNHPGIPIKEIWEKLFESSCPEIFEFTAGSNFGVSADEIRKYPIETYQKILELIHSDTTGNVDYCFERMWRYVFTQNLIGKQEYVNPPLENSLNLSGSEFRVVVCEPKGSSKYMPLIGNDDEMWDTISSIIDSEKILIISSKYNQAELDDLITNKLSVNSNVLSEYVEFKFDTWRAIMVESKILMKNRNKKKTFIKPFIETIRNKLL